MEIKKNPRKKSPEELEIRRKNRDHPVEILIKIHHNPLKRPGNIKKIYLPFNNEMVIKSGVNISHRVVIMINESLKSGIQ